MQYAHISYSHAFIQFPPLCLESYLSYFLVLYPTPRPSSLVYWFLDQMSVQQSSQAVHSTNQTLLDCTRNSCATCIKKNPAPIFSCMRSDYHYNLNFVSRLYVCPWLRLHTKHMHGSGRVKSDIIHCVRLMYIIIENHMIAPHLVVALNQGHNIVCN